MLVRLQQCTRGDIEGKSKIITAGAIINRKESLELRDSASRIRNETEPCNIITQKSHRKKGHSQ
jgi:hypothetical protein